MGVSSSSSRSKILSRKIKEILLFAACRRNNISAVVGSRPNFLSNGCNCKFVTRIFLLLVVWSWCWSCESNPIEIGTLSLSLLDGRVTK